ncbi:ankyrin repeat-containing protein BDA1 [Capsicum chacoense]
MEAVKNLMEDARFMDTPLHIAASEGCTHFAIEIMSLKHSFCGKLNTDRLSPLDLALRNGHGETMSRMVQVYPELIRVKEKRRITPLHYVAQTDDVNLLAEFLLAYPASIEDLTICDDTAVHIAVKNRKEKSFNVLLGWLQRNDYSNLLDWKDKAGNTALHVAASTNQPRVVRRLIKRVYTLNEVNTEALTVFDVVLRLPIESSREIKKVLHKAGVCRASLLPSLHAFLHIGLPEDMRNVLLVVAVVIATTSYQAVLSPPGGFYFSNNDDGKLQLSLSNGQVQMPGNYLNLFLIFNSLAFALSIGMMVLFTQESLGGVLLDLALLFLILSYFISMFSISGDTYKTSLISVGCAISIISLLFLFFLIIMTKLWVDAPGTLLLDCFTHRETGSDRMQYRLVAKKYSLQVGHKCKGIHCNDNIGILHNLAFRE